PSLPSIWNRSELTKYKHQIPNKFQIRISKSQTEPHRRFGIFLLGFICDLFFGYFDLSFIFLTVGVWCTIG
ncbi:MAG: hypothetical protein KFF68_16380, partial [Desulfosarcina sp.]|nr:hypothetical protein [Desulfosarcina sp.]